MYFSDYLYTTLNCHDHSVGSHFKLVRSFFNYLNEEKDLDIGSFHERFRIVTEDTKIHVISPERLNLLINDLDFESKLAPRQILWKDVMIFGCTVALRYSDLLRISSEHIVNEGERTYLVIRSQKTDTDVRVKLPPYAIRIIKKYSKRPGRLFPKISKTNFNKAMKRIAFLAGWTEETPKTRNKRGVHHLIYKDPEKKIHYRFCDVISSHTLRRTAITTMLRLGMEEIYVRRISGHAPHTGSFYRYVQFANGFVDEQLDKVYARLSKMKTGKEHKYWSEGSKR